MPRRLKTFRAFVFLKGEKKPIRVGLVKALNKQRAETNLGRKALRSRGGRRVTGVAVIPQPKFR